MHHYANSCDSELHWAASFQNNVYHSLIRAFAYHTKYICPVLKVLAIDAGEIRNRIININAQQKIRKKTDKKCCLKH